MNCEFCGENNNMGAKYCANCGKKLTKKSKETVTAMPVTQEATIENPIVIPAQQKYKKASSIRFSYFKFLGETLIKPCTTIKKNEKQLSKMETSIILSVLVVSIMTALNFIWQTINVVIVSKYSWTQGKTIVRFVWENMAKMNWIETLLGHFICCIGLIAFIAVIFYIASLIINKKGDYVRMVSITASSFVPILITTYFLSVITSQFIPIWGVVLSGLGIAYGICTLIKNMNRELKLRKDDHIIYVDSICVSIIVLAIYFVVTELLYIPVITIIRDGLSFIF